MKNLALLKSSPIAAKVIGEIGRFYIEHQNTILTCGTIGFSMASTALALKNAAKITEIVNDMKFALATAGSKEEKNQIYKLALKELAPLVLPILIFQAATIGCAIASKKQLDMKDKKIAELAGALSIAQTAVTQYQAFTKDAEEALGEKKYQKLQEDIYSKKEFDGTMFPGLASQGGPGEVLLIDKYLGRPFWGTLEKCDYAAQKISSDLASGSYELRTLGDYFDYINNPDLECDCEKGVLAEKFGYVEGSYGVNDIHAKAADSHYRFPNGTKVPAFVVYLYPEPACIDYNCD